MNIDDVIRGYITGFFDGEGNIDITRYQLRARITNTNYDVLQRLKSKFGGAITKSKLRKLKSGDGYQKQKWLWSALCNDAIEVLKYISIYSIEKRTQVYLGLRYVNEIKNCQGGNIGLPLPEIQKREWFRNKMKRLKHEKYDEKVLKDYDNEIKKLSVDKEVRDGNQLVLSMSDDKTYADLDEIYRMYGIKENDEIKDDKIVEMPDDVFVGYCAGFFDAEGSVHIGVDYCLRTKITNTNFGCLKIINEKFDGYINPLVLDEKYKPEWLWTLNSDGCIPFLKCIEPYSIIKGDQIGLAIEYQTKVKKTPNFIKGGLSLDEIKIREWYRQKLHELKRQCEEDAGEYNNNVCKYDIVNKGETLADY